MIEANEVKNSVFETLNSINVNGHTEKKNGLTYLSWAWAWAEVKKAYPDAFYTIYENKDGWNYFTDGRTCWVKTGVTINGLEHIEYLPIMDFKNKAIELGLVTSFDVNKAIQRSLTKACARHGLGLYIYAGEDLPEGEEKPVEKPVEKTAPAPAPKVDENAPIDKNHEAALMKRINNDMVLLDYILKCYEIDSLSKLTLKGLGQINRNWELVVGKAHASENTESVQKS